MPPALVTAATTSRQWLKARIGTSIPNISVTAVRMVSLLARVSSPPARDRPRRGALLEVGPHALPRLVAGEQLRRQRTGPGERLVDRHPRHLREQPLGRGHGAGAAGQQVVDGRGDLVVEPIRGHGGVDEPDPGGLGGGEPGAPEERGPGVGGTQLGQADHGDDRRRHADAHLGEPELGVVGGDGDVHGGGEPHAPGDAVAGDPPHVRLGRPGEPAEQVLGPAHRRRPIVAPPAPDPDERSDRSAPAQNTLPPVGEHDHPHLGVGVRGVERVAQLADEPGAQGVAVGLVRQRDGEHAPEVQGVSTTLTPAPGWRGNGSLRTEATATLSFVARSFASHLVP